MSEFDKLEELYQEVWGRWYNKPFNEVSLRSMVRDAIRTGYYARKGNDENG